MDIIMRPTNEEVANHLRTGLTGGCLICGGETLAGAWTTLNGEFRCAGCGMVYQVISCKLSSDYLDILGIEKNQVAKRHCPQFEQLPLYTAYHRETGNKLALGTYFPGDEEYTQKEYDAFGYWLFKNKARLRPAYDDCYDWDVIDKYYAM